MDSLRFADPVALEIAWSRIQSVLDEAETVLMRTAFSPIIREAYDFGVVLLDAAGGSVGQSQRSLPSFVGTLPRSLKAMLQEFPVAGWREGDVYATNDPWIGTGHLPDVTMARPILRRGVVVAFAGCIAHWADIGGAVWSADTRELFEEGLQLPLCKLVDQGRLEPLLASIIRRNVRLPEQVMGDLHAQLATMEVCERRFQELMDDMGLDDPSPLFAVMRQRSESVMRAANAALPDGRYVQETVIDGIDAPLLLRAALEIAGEAIHVDWTGSAGQVERGINESYNHAYAMTVYPIKCVLCPDIPNNEGAYLPVTMTAPEGTIINCSRPAAVGSRQILGHCIANVVLAALGQVLPERVLADCGSPSPRIVFSGAHADGRRYNAALLLAGGMGGQSWRDGLSAAPFPSNPGVTSVEVIESSTPLLFRRRALRPDSGGAGTYRGGLGATTEVELRADRPGLVSVMTDRIHHPPLGFRGGEPGAPNAIFLDGEPVDPKARTPMLPGSVLSVHTAGGGGYGPKERRDPEAAARDEEFGYVSARQREARLRGIA